jgi:hypothetical protein
MQPYNDHNGDSGVLRYETTLDSITVQFKDGAVYQYTNASAGSGAIAAMKLLATGGNGLNAYINLNVRKKYASKLR